LATAYGIVKQHDGFVNVYTEPGQGTTFRIYLPAAAGAPEPRPAAATEPVPRGTETILVAEDHEGLRELAHRALTSQGYRVILASDGQEAVQLFRAHSNEIHLVILDVVMPVLSGPGAYSQMCAIRADLPVIYTSGHTAESALLKIEEGGVFLQKPYPPQILGRAVRSTLDR
jgi:DNA-binding NtrC family response regulator